MPFKKILLLLATIGFIFSFYTLNKSGVSFNFLSIFFISLFLFINGNRNSRLTLSFYNFYYVLNLNIPRIVSQIFLAIIFFAFLTPFSFILKIFGFNPLKLRRIKVKSYWLERTKTPLDLEAFKHDR